jgi:hypothetical protein
MEAVIDMETAPMKSVIKIFTGNGEADRHGWKVVVRDLCTKIKTWA